MTRPLKILHLRDTSEVGGPGKTILETFSHIDSGRFSLSVAVFRARGETETTPFMQEAARRGISVHEIRSRNQFDPAIVRGIVTLVKSLGVDILHTHEAMSDICGLVAARICRIPVVSTMHGWIANGLKQEIYTKIDKKVSRFFQRVIVVNAPMKDALIKEGVAPDIISVLHNGIVTRNYFRDGTTGYIDEAVGTRLPRPLIGTLGRLSPEKGHLDFVTAAAIVAGRGLDAHFVIVGDGPETPKLKAAIRRHGLERSVTLAGYLRDPRRVLQDFDLMVLPSHTEGLPNVVLESLMMGVPVIATPVGGVPEIINDRVNGVLVPGKDPARLADALIDFLNNPDTHRAMARAGKQDVENRFDFKVRTRKLEKIYTDIGMGRSN